MTRPNVLVLAGHDPSGGAGIQADIEAVAANGAHAATLVTLLTCQDTHNVYAARPTDNGFLRDCLERVLADMAFAAIKIGALADAEQVDMIADLAQRLHDVPLVVDPVLRAAGGGRLADDAVALALTRQLFGRAAVVTPNAAEARLLCDGETDLHACGVMLSQRAPAALITGGDEGSGDIVDRLYVDGTLAVRATRPRRTGIFHGSGCTLSSAIAAQLARQPAGRRDLQAAIEAAQAYVQASLAGAFAAGRGQKIPDRPNAGPRAAP